MSHLYIFNIKDVMMAAESLLLAVNDIYIASVCIF